MITSLESLQALFEKMDIEGWNTDSVLKWGFFFFDKDQDKLLLYSQSLKITLTT